MKKKVHAVITAGLTSISTLSLAGPSLPSGGGGSFAMMRQWLQDLVDFMAGPFGTAAVIISCIIGFITWAFAPKEGVVGVILRVVVSGIVILNVGSWLMSLQAS